MNLWWRRPRFRWRTLCWLTPCKIVEAQIQFWHGKRKCAFDHYVFMLNAVEDGYGGLEHRRSTALLRSAVAKTCHAWETQPNQMPM